MDEDQEDIQIPDEVRQRLVAALQKMLEMGVAAVYGREDEDSPDALPDCTGLHRQCRARCCTLTFALTKEEVSKGLIKHNPARPFFIARDPDGYCPHLDREALRCTVWEDRPLRCRRYDCSRDNRE